MRVLISAGEVSGDVVAARIACTLRSREPACCLYGLGGPHMAEAGVDLVAATTHLGSVGVTEAAAVSPRLFQCWRRLRARVLEEPPDVALLIGNDFFHVLLARRLRALGVRTVSCFPPQVWVWRSVAGLIARSFDIMLASFPEEERIYRAAGGNVWFTGHYLADVLERVTPEERVRARAALALPVDATVIGLLPGSRVHEVRRIGPPLLDAAVQLAAHDPSLRFALPVANDRLRSRIERQIQARHLGRAIRLTDGGVEAMRAADLLLVASGTATIEGMLLGIPMVVTYRVSALTHLVILAALRLGLLPAYMVGGPNIILGRHVVPELLQGNLTGAAVAAAAAAMLSSPERQRTQRAALAEAAARLAGGGALACVADAVIALANRRSDPAWVGGPVSRRML